MAAAVLFALGAFAGLALPAPPDAGIARWRGRLARAAWPVALAAPLLFAAYLGHGLVPALSPHLSQKALLDAYHRLGDGRTPLGLYRIERESGVAFDRAATVDVAGVRELAAHLRRPGDAFAIVPRSELAAIDDAFAAEGLGYAVADASSSRYLLLAARLPAAAPDRNPLRASVWRPSKPGERPPWPPPRVPVSAVFGEAIELLGADFPAGVRRPSSVALALTFRVVQRPPSGYKIFVHLESPGEPMVLGDHDPLGGAFPTAHWRPGDVVRDEHRFDVPLVTNGSGRYALSMGFWPGGDTDRRLAITAGAGDGHNRVPLGTIEVK
jgi:hypothetical protein